MDYSELVKSLRICVKSTNCVGCIKNANGTEFGCKPLGDSELVLDAADAIEELQATIEREKTYTQFWEDAAKNCKAQYEELLRAAKKMHTWIFLNTGDEQKAYDECGLSDEMNSVLGYGGRLEIKVDPCADCVHYPPSSTDGKPCCACDPANPLTNCHEAKEETE